MGGIEETAVEAEESVEEAAMKGKGSEALQKTKGRGDDLLEQGSEYSGLCNTKASSAATGFILHF